MAVKEQAPFKVGHLCDFLNARGVETRPIVAGNIAIQPAMRYYEHRVVGDLVHTNNVMRNGFTFGNHQDVDGSAREYITGVIKEFAAERGLI
jgi:CDP-6-deoxy-D-xylo-4-hexulose-3-dehydrase